MQESGIKKARAVLAFLLFTVIISSVFFESTELHHYCSGEDCKICLTLQISRQNINLLLLFFMLSVKTVFTPVLYFKSIFYFKKNYLKKLTLISQKIRLND